MPTTGGERRVIQIVEGNDEVIRAGRDAADAQGRRAAITAEQTALLPLRHASAGPASAAEGHLHLLRPCRPGGQRDKSHAENGSGHLVAIDHDIPQ